LLFQPIFPLYIFANKVFYIFYMSWASFYFNLPWLNLLTKYEIVGKAVRGESVIISCSACLIWFDFFFFNLQAISFHCADSGTDKNICKPFQGLAITLKWICKKWLIMCFMMQKCEEEKWVGKAIKFKKSLKNLNTFLLYFWGIAIVWR